MKNVLEWMKAVLFTPIFTITVTVDVHEEEVD